jgi:catechol 2,3-dioxygenase-like lactoylglutathione lyase family enzyme
LLNGIDHIVVIVPDLETAIRNYGELGFTVTRGGKHPIGSENALIPFADGSYIELIAFTTSEERHPWQALLEKGGGLIDFCAATDNLEADRERFRFAGAPLTDPMPLSRTRPDGFTLRWRLSIPLPPWFGIVPFLIEDETPRQERVPRNSTHQNGAIGIGAVTLAVEDLAAVRRVYEAILGQLAQKIDVPELSAHGLRLQIGPHVCEVLSPHKSGGEVAEWLRSRGPSLFSATLNIISDSNQALDLRKTLNARLFLERRARIQRN